MKFSPGVVPQWPSRRGLTCSTASGSRSVLMISHDELPEGVVHARYRLSEGRLLPDPGNVRALSHKGTSFGA